MFSNKNNNYNSPEQVLTAFRSFYAKPILEVVNDFLIGPEPNERHDYHRRIRFLSLDDRKILMKWLKAHYNSHLIDPTNAENLTVKEQLLLGDTFFYGIHGEENKKKCQAYYEYAGHKSYLPAVVQWGIQEFKPSFSLLGQMPFYSYPRKILDYFEPLANQGSAKAMYRCAEIYNFNTNDRSKTFFYYKQAAQLDDTEALCQLGVGLTSYKKSKEYLKKAGMLGDPNGLLLLSKLLLNNASTEDAIEASRYLSELAFQKYYSTGNWNSPADFALIDLANLFTVGCRSLRDVGKSALCYRTLKGNDPEGHLICEKKLFDLFNANRTNPAVCYHALVVFKNEFNTFEGGAISRSTITDAIGKLDTKYVDEVLKLLKEENLEHIKAFIVHLSYQFRCLIAGQLSAAYAALTKSTSVPMKNAEMAVRLGLPKDRATLILEDVFGRSLITGYLNGEILDEEASIERTSQLKLSSYKEKLLKPSVPKNTNFSISNFAYKCLHFFDSTKKTFKFKLNDSEVLSSQRKLGSRLFPSTLDPSCSLPQHVPSWGWDDKDWIRVEKEISVDDHLKIIAEAEKGNTSCTDSFDNIKCSIRKP